MRKATQKKCRQARLTVTQLAQGFYHKNEKKYPDVNRRIERLSQQLKDLKALNDTESITQSCLVGAALAKSRREELKSKGSKQEGVHRFFKDVHDAWLDRLRKHLGRLTPGEDHGITPQMLKAIRSAIIARRARTQGQPTVDTPAMVA